MSLEGTGTSGADPRFLTDDAFMEAYLSHVEKGAPPYLAAELAGVSRFTFYKWLHRGGHPRVADTDEEAYEPYATFVSETLMAEAKAHIDLVEAVHAKAQTDATVGVRYMKVRYPEDYGDQVAPTVIVEQRGGPFGHISVNDLMKLHDMGKESAGGE